MATQPTRMMVCTINHAMRDIVAHVAGENDVERNCQKENDVRGAELKERAQERRKHSDKKCDNSRQEYKDGEVDHAGGANRIQESINKPWQLSRLVGFDLLFEFILVFAVFRFLLSGRRWTGLSILKLVFGRGIEESQVV